MKKYHKSFKKYQSFKNKQKRNKNNKLNNSKTYFDKLYIRIFLSSLLLLILLGGKNLLKLNIFNTVSNNMNILPIVNLFTKVYDFNNDLPVNVINNYDNIEYNEGINYITNESFNGVSIINTGIVVKIEKKSDLYFVTIKDEDGIEYIYGNLTNLDISLYSYVTTNKTIGTANFNNNHYSFTIEIKDGNIRHSLLSYNND